MITFRRLEGGDFDLMHQWLNEPGVVEWWEGDDVSPEAVRSHYFTDVEAEVEHWLALDDDTPFGWIQCYPVTSALEECAPWLAMGVPETTAGKAGFRHVGTLPDPGGSLRLMVRSRTGVPISRPM